MARLKTVVGMPHNRCQVVLIPTEPVRNMLIKHLERKGIRGMATCFVNPAGNWTRKPSKEIVIEMLKKTLKEHPLEKTREDRHYPMGKISSHAVKCRKFDASGPKSGPFEGDFVIRCESIEGRYKAALHYFEKYYGHPDEDCRKELEGAFDETRDDCKKELVFCVKHVHPAPQRD